MISDEELIGRARAARERAYAPYSSFKVGAALLTQNGQVFTGCNVENISYGLTICAERVAVGGAIEGGISSFALLAVVSDSFEPVVPCGACRQVLAEFNPILRIISATLSGASAEFTLEQLLPTPRRGILG